MQVKMFLGAAAVIGALGGAGAVLGAGVATADDQWWDPVPPPGQIGQWVGVPPGQIGQWVGVPPGHWDKPWKAFH